MKNIWLSLCAAIVVAFAFCAPASASTYEPWLAPAPHAVVDHAVQTPLAAVAGDEASACHASAGCAVQVAAFDGTGSCSERHATSVPSRCYGLAAHDVGPGDEDENPDPDLRT